MSATDQMRAMLDQLMGTTRNGDDGRGLKFSDNRVCKSFLLDCCPHDILASTRMDLGECPKIHDLAFRADYENAIKTRDYYYDIEAMEHLQAFIADCDRRTEAAKQRLKETQEELTAEVAEKANAVHALAEEIGKKLAKAEALGEAGEVEESMALMKEIEELRTRKVRAEHEYRTSMPASTYQQQKLRVCEVCSAYLGIHDNDIRLADHFGGKLHLGFLTIREKLVELEKTAGPRKMELKRSGKIQDRDDKRHRGRYFVGGRELDRRSRVHRSRSRERQRRTEDVIKSNDNNTNSSNNNNNNNSLTNGSGGSSVKSNSNPSIGSSSTDSNPNMSNSSISSVANNMLNNVNKKIERGSRGSGRDRNERIERSRRSRSRSRSRSATYSSKHKSSSSRRRSRSRSRSRNRYNSRR